MRSIVLIAGAALALAGCDSRSEADNNMTVDNLAVDNLVLNDGTAMDANLTANMPADSDTANMMANDLTTNDADTNLANGL